MEKNAGHNFQYIHAEFIQRTADICHNIKHLLLYPARDCDIVFHWVDSLAG